MILYSTVKSLKVEELYFLKLSKSLMHEWASKSIPIVSYTDGILNLPSFETVKKKQKLRIIDHDSIANVPSAWIFIKWELPV